MLEVCRVGTLETFCRWHEVLAVKRQYGGACVGVREGKFHHSGCCFYLTEVQLSGCFKDGTLFIQYGGLKGALKETPQFLTCLVHFNRPLRLHLSLS
ncbi:hypothetical protein UPYG_G00046840 [Umbra pygmaea]|uniref:Uncharacterized protein n=1 Tax=Umbra pygmaea TaxID=75934 RepID=A0ABD0Y9U8_UMBPY